MKVVVNLVIILVLNAMERLNMIALNAIELMTREFRWIFKNRIIAFVKGGKIKKIDLGFFFFFEKKKMKRVRRDKKIWK